jgi:hypothetical protein
MPLYALGPVEGLRIRRLIDRMARYTPPASAPHWTPTPLNADPLTLPGSEPVTVAGNGHRTTAPSSAG